MNEPRFYLVAVTGAPCIGGGGVATSYSVLDSAQCHREVFTQYAGVQRNNAGAAKRLARCEREVARRNALDAAGCLA